MGLLCFACYGSLIWFWGALDKLLQNSVLDSKISVYKKVTKSCRCETEFWVLKCTLGSQNT